MVRKRFISKRFWDNIHLFKETDPDLKLKNKHYSMASVNPDIIHDSSSRGIMFEHQRSQYLVIENPDIDITQTSVIKDFGKYTLAKQFDKDVEIIDVIKRYPELGDKSPETLVIFKDLETNIIDALEVPAFSKLHPYFGFKYNKTETLDELYKGDSFEKGTVLAKPTTLKDNGDYGYGKNVNCCYMSLNNNDEDGFIVSKSFCKMFKFDLFNKYSLSVNDYSMLLNLYGKNDEYKPFPHIGEKINDDNILFALRDLNNNFTPGLLSKNDIKDVNPIFDKAVFIAEGDSEVIDIKVYKNNIKKKIPPEGTEDILEQYSNSLLNYYKNIINIYEILQKEYNSIGLDLGKHMSSFLHMLVTDAYSIVDSSRPDNNIKKTYRKEELELYKIDIHVKTTIEPYIGYKITDDHGGKGVIVDIWDDKDMPIDKDGNRADIIFDPKSVIARLNNGKEYRRYRTAGSRNLRKDIRDFLNKNKKLNDTLIKYIFKNKVLEFYKCFKNKHYEYYKKLYKDNDIEALKDIIFNIKDYEAYILIDIEDDVRGYEVVDNLIESKYKPLKDKVKYRYNGELKTSKEDILIAPLYLILLNKIADDVLTCSSAKLNPYGLPISVSKEEKNRFPYKNTPVRFTGESEVRVVSAYGGEEFVIELLDMSSNPDTHALVYRNIITADKPTDIERIINREKHPYGNTIPLRILDTLFYSVGLGLKFVEDKNKEIPYSGNIEEEIIPIDELEDVSEVDDV